MLRFFFCILCPTTMLLISSCRLLPAGLAKEALHEKKKRLIIAYLHQVMDSGKVIAGQNVGGADPNSNRDYDQFFGLSRKPGVFAVDLGWYNNISIITPDLTPMIEKAWEQGSLISMSAHMAHPVNRSPNRREGEGDPFPYADAYTSGTVAYKNLREYLSNIADYLQEMEDRDIIVLWRPYHEMNGGWFWWSHKNFRPTPEQFAALWRYTHDYLTRERGLTNLLWVYSAATQRNEKQLAVDYYYPGDAWVDVVGIDYYSGNLEKVNRFDQLTTLAKYGKPVALTEIGLLQRREASAEGADARMLLELVEHHVAYFVVWHSWGDVKVSLRDMQHTEALMQSEKIITQDEMAWCDE